MINLVFLVVGALALIYFFISKNGLTIDGREIIPASTGGGRKIALIVGIAFLLAASGAKVIPSDSRGLRFTFGAISQQALKPGLHFNIPLAQNIKTVTIRPLEVNTKIEVNSDGAITKDNQTIGSEIALFYIYKEDALPLMWKDFGEEKLKSIALKSTTESFKAQVGRYDIFELPLSQDSIRLKTLKQIRSMVANYPITITELKITNYDWSDDFDAQIKETMNRSQQVKQKEQELLITEQESQKVVKKAEADKTALITTAEGEKAAAELRAEAKALEGEGIRKYNESIAKTIELEIKLRQLKIEEIKAERWNGQFVPTNNYGPIPVQTGMMQPK
jgi:regulator of protease activity HflC (stomatin/prohibitin superfamily)